MKQFSLEEYLKNPSRKLVTRDGRNVRIICTDRRGYKCPIVALIERKDNEDDVRTFTKDGIWDELGGESINDLFFAPEKHEGWVNIFKGEDYHHIGDAFIYKSREEAEKLGKGFSNYLATSKIEWEE